MIAEAEGAALCAELGESGAFLRVVVSDEPQIRDGIQAATQRFGGLDFIVNVAARYLDQGVDSDSARWLESLKVNLVAAALTARYGRPHLPARGGGAIVNFSSTSAKVAQAGRWTYPAAKVALLQLTRSQTMDLAADGIREANRSEGKFHQLGRIGEAEEVASAVLFLCSDGASFMTGTEVIVDGGFLAMGPDAIRSGRRLPPFSS